MKLIFQARSPSVLRLRFLIAKGGVRCRYSNRGHARNGHTMSETGIDRLLAYWERVAPLSSLSPDPRPLTVVEAEREVRLRTLAARQAAEARGEL